MQVIRSDFLGDRTKFIWSKTVLAAVSLVSQSHHIVQALLSRGQSPNMRVQQETYHRSFYVVAHGRLIVAANAGCPAAPNAHRGLLKRLHEPARRVLQLANQLRN